MQIVPPVPTHNGTGITPGNEALINTDALQRAIFNSKNFSSIATDAQGVIQIFNVGAECMLGYAAIDVINRITPADISDPIELVARAAALSVELETHILPGFEALVFKASHGIEDIYELTYIRKDGSRIPAVVSVTALRCEQNTIIGYLLIGTDNTARHQSEEAKEEALGRLQKIASRLPGVVYQYRLRADGSSCFPFASDGISEIYRLKPEEVVEDASKVFALLHPDDLDEVTASIHRSAAELTLWHHEYQVKFDDGTVCWLLGNAMPQREADGSVLWHGFISEINERKLAEKEINSSHQRFETLLNAVPDLMFEFDSHGRYLNAWSSQDNLLAAPVDQLLGRTVSEVLPHLAAEAVLAAIAEADSKGYSFGRQFMLSLPQGDNWFELSVSKQSDDDAQDARFITLSRDITERHLMHTALSEREAKYKAQSALLKIALDNLRMLAASSELALSNERKRIAYELHDELGQLLAALRLDIGTLKMEYSQQLPALIPRTRQMLELLSRAINSMRGVVTDLRPLALDMGLQLALEWLKDDFTNMFKIPCMLSHSADIPKLSELQLAIMFRITQELLTNVARHANASRVYINLQADDDSLRLTVQDDGIGFDLETTRLKRQNFGLLGMQERMRMLGGELIIDTAPGSGCRMSLNVPIIKEDETIPSSTGMTETCVTESGIQEFPDRRKH